MGLSSAGRTDGVYGGVRKTNKRYFTNILRRK